MNIMDGLKTKLLGLVVAGIGILEIMSIDVVSSVDHSNAFEWIVLGIGIFTGRDALRKIEKKE